MKILAEYYELMKALHVIAVISWMVGMLYLPRLFVYHVKAVPNGELDETLKIMELRLLRYIINPAMVATYILGLLLAYVYGFSVLTGWFHVKFTAVLVLSAMHGMFAKWRKDFFFNKNTKSENFFRVMNEVPTLMMIIIVIMVIIKPF